MRKISIWILLISLIWTSTSQIQSLNQSPLMTRIERPIDCLKDLNLYWTGYRCACRVGYAQENGVCLPLGSQSLQQPFRPSEFIYKISKLHRLVQCSQPNEMLIEGQCVCAEGYARTNEGTCETIIQCGINEILLQGQCVCQTGYNRTQTGICLKICPTNSIDNGSGQCVCMPNFVKQEDGSCKKAKTCPASSILQNEVCVCIDGYEPYYDGSEMYCAKCPDGQFWVQSSKTCQIICAMNEIYNSTRQRCQCKANYGKYEGVCSLCPSGFFVKDGFCIKCPINSQYDTNSNQCKCKSGYVQNVAGLCQSLCTGANQEYSVEKQKCLCVDGFGFSDGSCTICSLGVDVNGNCKIVCGVNEVFTNEQCVCADGFGLDVTGSCVDCTAVSGGFLIDGVCGLCPTGFVWNVTCVCPEGKTLNNGICAATCKTDQLVDASGLCYYCPINEVITNGQCTCQVGFTRSNGVCQPACGEGEVIVNGLCGRCALNHIYNAELQACVCPENHYKNLNGYCEQADLEPITCDEGSFLHEDQGCVSCPAGCSSCSDANTCTGCSAPGFVPRGGECVPQCGDGRIIYGVEECDDGNLISKDGCSSTCEVEQGWVCVNQPSACTGSNCGNGEIDAGEACDDGNRVNGDGCSEECEVESSDQDGQGGSSSDSNMELSSPIVVNGGAVYMEVQTAHTFLFNSESEMKSFMKYEFESAFTQPTSAYCMQDVTKKDIFKCLFLYVSGLPTIQFTIRLHYARDGGTGSLTVDVNPFNNAISNRSLV